MSDISVALNRFGLGARANEALPGDARRSLLDQFARFQPRPAALHDAPTTAAAGEAIAAYLVEVRERGAAKRAQADLAKAGAKVAEARQGVAALYVRSVNARLGAAVASEAPFVERLVHFWANHFAVSADKLPVTGLAGPFEFDAIRPHVLGRFADLLQAVERHPAMLLYLDQAPSVGPGSPFGQRAAARGRRKAGLNENLAREILELHTLGVRTGYGQGDVTEFARALTGWTVAGITRGGGRAARRGGGAPGSFTFAAQLHEPGARTILGQRFDQAGEAQAAAVLDMLAVHPATARHVATKLVRHFVGDDPPAAAVLRVEQAFLSSGGDLPTVYCALVAAPEAWAEAAPKFKSPWEWTVSAMRATDTALPARQPRAAVGLFQQLGQPVWRPGQPSGYDDTAAAWAAPDALMRRVEAAARLAQMTGDRVDARARAAQLFPDTLSPATASAIARAESPGEGLALFLVSPEFLRR